LTRNKKVKGLSGAKSKIEEGKMQSDANVQLILDKLNQFMKKMKKLKKLSWKYVTDLRNSTLNSNLLITNG
jgi:hypothetical protein